VRRASSSSCVRRRTIVVGRPGPGSVCGRLNNGGLTAPKHEAIHHTGTPRASINLIGGGTASEGTKWGVRLLLWLWIPCGLQSNGANAR
jgi:hypothetical protein